MTRHARSQSRKADYHQLNNWVQAENTITTRQLSPGRSRSNILTLLSIFVVDQMYSLHNHWLQMHLLHNCQDSCAHKYTLVRCIRRGPISSTHAHPCRVAIVHLNMYHRDFLWHVRKGTCAFLKGASCTTRHSSMGVCRLSASELLFSFSMLSPFVHSMSLHCCEGYAEGNL